MHGLYAITDPDLLPDDRLVEGVTAALAGGARAVQFRDKRPDRARRQALAAQLNTLCRDHDALFLVNDDVELTAAVGAHGVHLGRDDPAIAAARERLGPQAIIGVSCYNELERARRARDGGADYVAFGRFFPSRTKPDAVQAGAELLRAARRELDLPLVAIGGITPENGGSLLAAGADMLAVIHGLFGAADIEAAARRYAALFAEETSRNR
ncbi:thiamine phosphate synthase [Thiohalobacter thiocyanaticus]|uniref:Thiamine-phosphate synthase n=1 Tax=Thiohalobacter thiocyanaticus TaxID=585455 RepID=A0A426QI90_9GAMM|nr:thiamine phosphate synthase [Thiohalobacter thiocyanaticus]RRQ21471.1 thiamine phosphate synthase [Thiohalobacter thiocyanaticus]